MQWRKIVVSVGATALLALAVTLLWFADWQYSLPTPRPASLVEVPLGTPFHLARLGVNHAPGQPLFLYFFNPDCPCSRFSVDHVRNLARRHPVRFLAIIPVNSTTAYNRLNLKIPSQEDPGGNLARSFGLYSTPQSALLDGQHRLYYRGNFNTSRYCVEPATEFARIAIEHLLGHQPLPAFPKSATTAYGCPYPRT